MSLLGCCCEASLRIFCFKRNERIRKEIERELVAELVAAGRAVTTREIDLRDAKQESYLSAVHGRNRRSCGTSLGLLPSGSAVQILSSCELAAETADCCGDLPPSVWYVEVVPPITILQPPKGASGNDLSQGIATETNMTSSSSGWIRVEQLGYLNRYNIAPAGQ